MQRFIQFGALRHTMGVMACVNFDAPDSKRGVDDILAAVGDIKKVHKEHVSAFEEFKAKNDEHLAEVKGGFDDVVRRDELKAINTAIDKTQETLDAFAARQKRAAMYGDAKGETAVEREEKHYEWAAGAAQARGEKMTRALFEERKEAVAAYKDAFFNYIRHRGDEKMLAPEQLKALSVGSDTDGGYMVDADTSGRIVGRVFETSPVRQYASVQSIGSDALEGLHDVDEADSGWVGETSARPETGTPTIEKWRIPVHEQYASPKATQKLLDDAVVNMETWLANKIADKLSRVENAAFVSGDGVGKPRGFLTYGDWATAGTFQLGAIEQFDTGVNGGFAASPDGGDVLIDALYGLKMQYRNNATWFMNRATTGEVRKLKDSDGAYIWAPGLAAGQPATVLGYGQASFEDMPDIATGALSIAVGDMRSAYQIVDRIGIRILRDPYTAKPYVIFYTTKRVGGDVVDFDALKLVRFSA